jgi:hypothetical protein
MPRVQEVPDNIKSLRRKEEMGTPQYYPNKKKGGKKSRRRTPSDIVYLTLSISRGVADGF